MQFGCFLLILVLIIHVNNCLTVFLVTTRLPFSKAIAKQCWSKWTETDLMVNRDDVRNGSTNSEDVTTNQIDLNLIT